MKKLFIAEKPSVAREFALALDLKDNRKNSYLEDDKYVVTWCLGHLISMSYPEKYDERYRKWKLEDLPFIPSKFKYELIENTKRQFEAVKFLLERKDIESIYVCTDSGREGEYIYRLVDEFVGVKDKKKYRVWIDSYTKEEILRGIKEAKDLSSYDNLSKSAYLRAKEDYLMGINFSRVLSLKYSYELARLLSKKNVTISVGRVMTCVLSMVVRREREIRDYKKQAFYKVILECTHKNLNLCEEKNLEFEFKILETSKYSNSPFIYKDNGFKKEKDAKNFIESLKNIVDKEKITLLSKETKKEVKNPPLLYNLAELQNECSKLFKISPDETLKVVQELYEKKYITYPRTDARVLSSVVAKDILNNLKGLLKIKELSSVVSNILAEEKYKNIKKTKYVNDKLITDHYAIIPTGYYLDKIKTLGELHNNIYMAIVKRFLSIFLEPSIYTKYNLSIDLDNERFVTSYKLLEKEGYLHLYNKSEKVYSKEFREFLKSLKKASIFDFVSFKLKEGESSPPKRYTSGSIILAMENAGQFIEDEDLRASIKGSGIGTSATRAEILKKLCDKKYLNLKLKTQVISPSLLGELIYEVVDMSIKALLDPKLSASWEKGLSYVNEGSVKEEEYMLKLIDFINKRTNYVKANRNSALLQNSYKKISAFYKEK